MRNIIEKVDLVDSSGNICKHGVSRAKLNLYPHLHLQIVIGVVFDKNGRILVHQRSKTKKVNPGDIDHICGGIMTGETPERAFVRESIEETGVKPLNLQIVTKGVNKYNRYRYLLIAESYDKPNSVSNSEVEWVDFIHPDELKAKHASKQFTFVDEFFEDTQSAISKKLNKKR
ncbi:NUDIX hydrolase [Candidatus Gottesmanbacteria bacterium]|nr:NUDIX hydrolase [Candidatus Gottesmanbacteria bacterium]